MIWPILTVAAVASSLRLLPFVFSEKLKNNRLASVLAYKLPPCIILLQIAYTLADQPFFSYPYGIPQLAGIATVIALHVWKRKMIVSIFGGFAIFETLYLLM